MSDEEIEKLIKQLLSLISSDYQCECDLRYNIIDHYSTKRFYICTYADNLIWQSYFVGNKIYETFDNLNDMLQTLLNPNYELWMFDGSNNNSNIKYEIPVAKKYGSTIEQLKIILDLKANI